MADDAKPVTSVHDLEVKTLEGESVKLDTYKGKVLLIVNVASECGATPQYKPLQALSDKYADQGLVVMGFPCNQFGSQEPGSASEIRQFCTREYSVKFPMFTKIDVNGSDQSPLYEYLKSAASDHSNIGWNFEKFLVGKDGKVIARFKTRTQPDSPEVIKLIEEALNR
ncbi:MAG: glutathione peroxidase [Planctomycetaceae bacterium]